MPSVTEAHLCIIKKIFRERSGNPPGYNEREIWWAQLGINVGDEEDGKSKYFSRPVLIIKGFSRYLVWIVPLTSNQKRGKYYHPIAIDGRTSVAILSQLRVLDTRRFMGRLGVLDEQSFEQVRRRLLDLIS